MKNAWLPHFFSNSNNPYQNLPFSRGYGPCKNIAVSAGVTVSDHLKMGRTYAQYSLLGTMNFAIAKIAYAEVTDYTSEDVKEAGRYHLPVIFFLFCVS